MRSCWSTNLGTGFGEGDGDVSRLHGRVPDHPDVLHAAVLVAGDRVADIAGVHRVALAQVVDLHGGGAVGRLLLLEDALAAEVVVEQGEIERRGDVLRGEEVEVVGLLRLLGEQGAEVGELRVGDLRVVERERPVRIGPGFLRVIEDHALVAAALEPVVVLERRAGHAQPGGVDVGPAEREVVEMVVVARVGHIRPDLAEIRVDRPGDDALVVERVGQGVGLQDARGRLRDAVADVLPLFADLVEGIGLRQLALDFLVEVVFLALFARKAGVPGLEGGLRPGDGVGQVDGVELVPEGGVEQGLERVARAEAQDRVGRLGRRVGELPGLRRGVAHDDLLQRQGAAQLVAGHGVGHRVLHGGRGRDPHDVRGGLLVAAGRSEGDEGRHRDRKCYARKHVHRQFTKLRTFGGFSKSAYIRS